MLIHVHDVPSAALDLIHQVVHAGASFLISDKDKPDYLESSRPSKSPTASFAGHVFYLQNNQQGPEMSDKVRRPFPELIMFRRGHSCACRLPMSPAIAFCQFLLSIGKGVWDLLQRREMQAHILSRRTHLVAK